MISVIIPAYNEEHAIEKVIEEIKEVLKKYKGSEIIVINDGSSDNTKVILKKLGVKVFDNERNKGYGYCLKKGIEASKNETIVITDCDLTYPFEEVPKMLEIKKQGYDMVVGARTGIYYRESFFKKLLRKFLKSTVEYMTDSKVNDVNSGLRVFDKKTTMKYFPRLCNTFSFTTSQTLAYLMNGYKVYYLDIPYNKRIGKSKVKLFKYSIITLKYIFEAGIHYNPKKIIYLFIILLLIILLIVGIILII